MMSLRILRKRVRINLKRVIGFGLFCFAMGMLFMMILSNEFVGFVIIALSLLIGYNLFCCR